jgi:hypothetical protein
MRLRVPLGTAGVLLALFGVLRLLTQEPLDQVFLLALWLIGAILIHDGILSPLVVATGWAIARVVPPRARRYLQAALIMAALVTIIAIPLIYRQGSQPKSKALLQQNYGANLTLLITIIATLTLLAYAIRVARDHSDKPPSIPNTKTTDQTSSDS